MLRWRIRVATLLTGAVLLLLAVLLPALSLVLTDFRKTGELVAIVQGAVTAFAILAGGFLPLISWRYSGILLRI